MLHVWISNLLHILFLAKLEYVSVSEIHCPHLTSFVCNFLGTMRTERMKTTKWRERRAVNELLLT